MYQSMILSEVAGGEKECLQHLKDSKKDVRDKDEYNFRVGELHLKLQEFGDAKKVSIILYFLCFLVLGHARAS